MINFNRKLNRFYLFFVIFCYKLLVEFLYIVAISPKYAYFGLELNINFGSLFISNILLLFLVYFFPRYKDRPSTYLYLVMMLFLVVPLFSYYWLNNKELKYVLMVFFCLLLISLILKMERKYIAEYFKTAKKSLLILFAIYILVTLYIVIDRGGIDVRAFDFSAIYDLRSETENSGILVYIRNWCVKAFCPFFFAYFLFNKNYKMVIVVSFLQILMYLTFGFKAYLFSIGMLIIVAYLMKKKNFEIKFTISLIVIMLTSYLFLILKISNSLIESLVFRLLIVPAQIQYQYYEFFNSKEKMYFADGLIGKIIGIESPFNESVPFVISMYFQGVVSNSNTGIFSDAYSNGGFFMMILIATIMAFTLWLIDSITYHIPIEVTVSSLSYMMFVMNDNSLLTAYLTGGLWIMLVLLFLLNSSIVKPAATIKV